jgi:hypothetical protein
MMADPTGVKLTIDGVDYMVTEQFKDAYDKNLAAQRDAAAREAAEKVKPAPVAPPSGDDDDDSDFILTKADLAKRERELADRLRSEIGSELTAKQAEQQIYQRFWDKFGKGLDRTKHEIVVNAVWGRDQEELQKMAQEKTVDEALDELGKRVKDVIAIEPITKQTEKQKQVLLEGAPQTSLQAGAGDEDQGSGYKSIGEILRARKTTRRNANKLNVKQT